MNRDDQWSVSLSVAETGGRTCAEARLAMAGEEQLAGSGEARLNPADQDVWAIGAQIAVARALSDLAGQLLHTAAAGIEEITHKRAHLHMWLAAVLRRRIVPGGLVADLFELNMAASHPRQSMTGQATSTTELSWSGTELRRDKIQGPSGRIR